MSKNISSLILLAVISVTCYSQTTDSLKNTSDLARKNKWAVQFEVGYDFKVTAFQGMALSVKYHLSEKSALRLGVGYDAIEQEESHSEYENYYGKSIDLEHSDHELNISCNYLYYSNTSSSFNLFLGIGPTARFSYYYSEYPDDESFNYTDASESFRWAAGLNGIVGVEWFPAVNFSLFAEYEAAGLYGETHETYWLFDENGYYHKKDETNGHEWRFDANTARLGISVYFDKLF